MGEPSTLAIFSSNYVERVGAKLLDMINICKRVFAGELIDAAALPSRDAEYERIVAHLPDDLKIKDPGVTHDAREIIQHAQAYDRNEPFSEQLIKQTHKILCNGGFR